MIACDHYRVPVFDGGDNGDDEAMRRFSKKRNSNNSNHRTSIAVESAPSNTVPNSPLSLASSSETITSLSFADTTDAGDVLGLPKRIVTLNVVRPVPKRIAEQFYDEAYREGSTLHETNQAAVMAHDWHRKWTHQDEAYHTMPEEDFYQSATTGIPASYCYNGFSNESHDIDDALVHADTDIDHHQATNGFLLVLQREEGAKNPSLGSSQEGKRKRFSSQTAKVTTSHHHSTTKQHQQHARPSLQQSQLQVFNEESNYEGTMVVSSSQDATFTEYDNHPEEVEHDQDNEHDDEIVNESHYNTQTSELQRPLPIRPMVVKPLAIRANRSEYIHPQPTYAKLSPFAQDSRNGAMGGGIPQDIITSHRNGVGCVSPMSFSQLTESSSMSSRSLSGGEMMGMTVFKNDQEELHLVEDDDLYLTTKEDQMTTISSADKMEKERDDILRVLAINDGDAESDDFKTKVDPLEKFFRGNEIDTRTMPEHPHHVALASSVSTSPAPESINGMWLTLSKPNYFGKIGENDNGDPLYTLGRMSFDMFSPTNLVCSLQGNFNQVEIVNEDDRKAMLERIPKKLREEVESGKTTLRTYHVITAFTIEPSSALYPNAPNKDVIRPIKGIMTTYGYSLPDPNTPNRHSIWFTGGRIEPNNDISDVLTWKNFFTIHPPKHTFGEKAKLLAVKLLMGATTPTEVDPEDGSMNYVFTRPLGGHGMAYIDVIYLDQSLRIVRGQRGTTFVFSRVPDG